MKVVYRISADAAQGAERPTLNEDALREATLPFEPPDLSFSGQFGDPRSTRQDHLLRKTRATTSLTATPNSRRQLVASEYSRVFPESPAASHHLFLWNSAQPIPVSEPHHPVRNWMTARNLYWTSISVPSAIRWFPATGHWPKHWGSGAIVVAFAPPNAWVTSWPQTPAPTSIQVFHIDNFGRTVVPDRNSPSGLNLRVPSGNVSVLGDPRPGLSTTGRLLLTNRLDNALALAARLPDTTAIVGGTSKLQSERLAEWLRIWGHPPIYAYSYGDDSDRVRNTHTKKPEAALLRRLKHRLITDYAYTNRLPRADLVATSQLADDLEQEGLPRWEADRLAIQVCSRIASKQATFNSGQGSSHFNGREH